MNTTANPNEAVVAYCRTCGKPLTEAAKREVYGVIYCEDCLAARVHGGAAIPGAPMQVAAVAYVPTAPNPALAFILGWIPGVGAMYNGQVAKGFVHVGVFALLVSILNGSEGRIEVLQPFFGLLLAGFVFYQVFDAYQTARALRYGQPVPDYLRILQTLEGFGLKSEARGTTYAQVVPTQPPAQPNAQSNVQPGAAPGQSQAFTPAGQPVAAYVAPMAAIPVEVEESAPERVPVSAVVLIALGVLFLLSTLDIFSIEGRYFFPLLLIGLGVWLGARRLTGSRR
jgi:Domain of unknown function (DUF5668)